MGFPGAGGGEVVASSFEPARWLPGPHAQTLWASIVRRPVRVPVERRRIELEDGDFVDLDWTPGGGPPIVLVLHGLEGSIRSRYASGLLRSLAAEGWRAAVMHFRGCSGLPNRLDRSYHSGETGDLKQVLRWLAAAEPGAPVAAVGYSLGGNVLLKLLGEDPEGVDLCAAVAVSVPFDLAIGSRRLDQGFSRFYRWALLRSLRRKLRAKFRGRTEPVDPARLASYRSFREFDDAVTARLHGFRDVEDYYTRASSRPYLRHIRVPTLILHAADDPFMTPEVIPDASELSASVRLELSEHGGHVGFVSGPAPWAASYWLEKRIPAFLRTHLESDDVRHGA